LPHTNPLVNTFFLVAAALAIAGCGSETSAPAHWTGSAKQNADGSVATGAFNDFLAGGGQAFAASPIAAVAEFLHLDRTDAAQTTVTATSPAEVRNYSEVVATLVGLADDSVRDARYTVELQRGKDGLWRLRAADWAQRCRAGRGHSDFAPAPCS